MKKIQAMRPCVSVDAAEDAVNPQMEDKYPNNKFFGKFCERALVEFLVG